MRLPYTICKRGKFWYCTVIKRKDGIDKRKVFSTKQTSKIKESTINDLTNKNVKLEKSVSKKNGQITELNNKLYATHFFTTIGSTYNLEDGFGVELNLGYTFGRGGIISCGISTPITTFTSPLKMADIKSYTASASIGWIW